MRQSIAKQKKIICRPAKRYANKLGNDYWFGLVWFGFCVCGTVAYESQILAIFFTISRTTINGINLTKIKIKVFYSIACTTLQTM